MKSLVGLAEQQPSCPVGRTVCEGHLEDKVQFLVIFTNNQLKARSLDPCSSSLPMMIIIVFFVVMSYVHRMTYF